MAKKDQPIITYAEILARAARNFQDEIDIWEKRLKGLPEGEELLEQSTKELRAKLDAIRTLYHIETGSKL